MINGRKISKEIQTEIKQKISAFKIKPKLSVILIGDRKDSEVYVRMKKRACGKVGILFNLIRLPKDVQKEDIIDIIHKLNNDSCVTGILVQLPIPKHLNEREILDMILPEKDVDCLTTVNIGKLFALGLDFPILPCTPKGCLELLQKYQICVKGKHVVVIGGTGFVGKPLSFLLSCMGATVTVCHIYTIDLPTHTKNADIIVSAVGKNGPD